MNQQASQSASQGVSRAACTMPCDYITPGQVLGADERTDATAGPADADAAVSLCDLPMDAVECILVQLSLRDRARACAVSRGWRELVSQSSALWATLESSELPGPSAVTQLCRAAGSRLQRMALRCTDPVYVRARHRSTHVRSPSRSLLRTRPTPEPPPFLFRTWTRAPPLPCSGLPRVGRLAFSRLWQRHRTLGGLRNASGPPRTPQRRALRTPRCWVASSWAASPLACPPLRALREPIESSRLKHTSVPFRRQASR